MDTKSVFDEIVLTKPERKLLVKLGHKPLSIKADGMHALLEWRLAAPDPDGLGERNHPRYKDTCHITERGRRYLAYCGAERRELWLKNVWIPIVVALITSALANYILPKLPQILQWAANTLSKTP